MDERRVLLYSPAASFPTGSPDCWLLLTLAVATSAGSKPPGHESSAAGRHLEAEENTRRSRNGNGSEPLLTLSLLPFIDIFQVSKICNGVDFFVCLFASSFTVIFFFKKRIFLCLCTKVLSFRVSRSGLKNLNLADIILERGFKLTVLKRKHAAPIGLNIEQVQSVVEVLCLKVCFKCYSKQDWLICLVKEGDKKCRYFSIENAPCIEMKPNTLV